MQLLHIFTGKPAGKFLQKFSGFTLVEVIIVISLFALLLGLSYPFTLELYRSYTLRTDTAMLVSVLQKARSQSLNNISEMSHGVHIDDAGYTIFQGSAFDEAGAQNEFIEKSQGVTVHSDGDIIFEQISGDIAPPFALGESTITLTDGVHTERITINNEGRINY